MAFEVIYGALKAQYIFPHVPKHRVASYAKHTAGVARSIAIID
jgi:hypothetical protein